MSKGSNTTRSGGASARSSTVSGGNRALQPFLFRGTMQERQNPTANGIILSQRNDRFRLETEIKTDGYDTTVTTTLREGDIGRREVLSTKSYKGKFADSVMFEGHIVPRTQMQAIQEARTQSSSIQSKANDQIKQWRKDDDKEYNKSIERYKYSLDKGFMDKTIYDRAVQRAKEQYKW